MKRRPVRARDYAKLHRRWYADEVLEACADIEGAAMWLWPLLIALGKEQLHDTRNPAGTIRTTSKRLADHLRTDPERITAALATLADGELITVDTGRLGTLKITVLRLADWQVAEGSSAESSADHRAGASRENVSVRDDRVTSGDDSVTGGDQSVTSAEPTPPATQPTENLRCRENVSVSDGSVTQTETETETTVSNESEGEQPSTVVNFPASTRSTSGQIRRARGRLGHLAVDVEGIIANRTASTTLTDSQLLRSHWLPAVQLLADHGATRLSEALIIAAGEGADSMKFVAKVCDRLQRKATTPAPGADPEQVRNQLDADAERFRLAQLEGRA